MKKEKIILDVDTGSDDAIAVILALLCEDFDVLGICAVGGNLDVSLTTANTLRVVDFCGFGGRVPVLRGCALPLVSTLMPWTPQSTGIMTEFTKNICRCIPRKPGSRTGEKEIHSDHLPLPETALQPLEKSAVVWLIDTLMAAEDHSVTLICTAPLTDLGVALRADPRIVGKIRRVILMGGGDRLANRTPAAEFNIWADPEAAEIVLQSGCDILFVPLDATHAAAISAEQAQQLRAIGTKEACFVADTIDHRIRSRSVFGSGFPGSDRSPVHDALAVCAAACPEVLTAVEKCNCHVDISGGYAYGRTIVDRREKLPAEPVNCRFALNADSDIFLRWMHSVLSARARRS